MLLFAVSAHCFCSGFSKILKKHDRWTGYRTREQYMRRVVEQEPFTQCSKLLTMLSTIEALFNEIGGHIEDLSELRLFEQHIAGSL